MSKFLLCVLVTSTAFASGNYQRSYNPGPPASPRPSGSVPSASAPKSSSSAGGSYVVGPQARDAKTIERDILRWDRQGVAIHGVRGAAEKFVVTGAYTHKSDFERFLKKLKGEDAGPLREVSVKETSTSFGGSTSYNFEAEVENAW